MFELIKLQSETTKSQNNGFYKQTRNVSLYPSFFFEKNEKDFLEVWKRIN